MSLSTWENKYNPRIAHYSSHQVHTTAKGYILRSLSSHIVYTLFCKTTVLVNVRKKGVISAHLECELMIISIQCFLSSKHGGKRISKEGGVLFLHFEPELAWISISLLLIHILEGTLSSLPVFTFLSWKGEGLMFEGHSMCVCGVCVGGEWV